MNTKKISSKLLVMKEGQANYGGCPEKTPLSENESEWKEFRFLQKCEQSLKYEHI